MFFGSRSVEHEVSVITAQQAMAAMPADRFTAVPVYIAKSGAWYTGDQLLRLEEYKNIERLIAAATRVTMRPDPSSGGELMEVDARRGLLGGSARAVDRFDVAMPLVHGSNGEDGTLQGLFELAALPYSGCDVASAAVSMDKRLSRTTLRGAGIPVLDDVMVSRAQWTDGVDTVCAELARRPGFPMYVKPRRLGSSIGVARVETDAELRDALEVAFGYDTSILAEPAQDASIEINCSVLGWGDDLQVSVCEQPVSSGTLSYADKYLSGAKTKGGAKAPAGGMKSSRRLIPAPISELVDQTHPGNRDGIVSRHRRRGRDPSRFPRRAGRGLIRCQRAQHPPGFTVVLPVGSLGDGLRHAADPPHRDGDGASSRAAGNHVIDRHVAPHRSSGLNGHPSADGASTAGPAGEFPPAALEDRGSGDPLLLLHGWGVSSELFAPILDVLGTGRRLIIPDLPGFGATAAPDEPWSVHDYAAWCVALLDRLGVETCDLIGHSNGGRIGIALAANHPGRVRRMVLAGSAGIRPRRTWRGAIRVRWYKVLRAVERSPALPAALRRAAGRNADQRGSADYRAVSGVMRGTLVRLVNEDLRGLLPNLHLPVLLIWGDQDSEAPLDDGRLMERLIPDAGLVVFEGAGHFAYLEQPGRFCRIVDVFLRDEQVRGTA